MRLNELKDKVVISVSDGSVLGYIRDIDFDLNEKRIEALIVEENKWKRLFPFIWGSNEVVISTSQISHIGEDVILIKNEDS